jgi:hypothetical protein
VQEKLVPNEPKFRKHRHSPWVYRNMTDADIQDKIEDVCGDIYDFFAAGGTRFEDEGGDTAELGATIIEKLDALNSRDVCRVYNCMWGTDEDHNSTIYQFRWFARAASKHNFFTEALVFYGPGEGGKDGKTSIQKGLFGDGKLNLMSVLPKTYFHPQNSNNPEGAAPITCSLRGSDLIILSEAPEGDVDNSKVKPFVEPTTRHSGRQNYSKKGDTVSLSISGALVCTQNHRMVGKVKGDDAFDNRIAHVYCPMIFKANPTPNSNERMCIPEYKGLYATEPWTCENFHWIRCIFKTLSLAKCRQITPRPTSVLDSAEETAKDSGKTTLINFLVGNCEWVDDRNRASSAGDITSMLAPLLPGNQVKVPLASVGVQYVKKSRSAPARSDILQWSKHPDYTGVPKFAKLKA